jgi:hypothetical protein
VHPVDAEQQHMLDAVLVTVTATTSAIARAVPISEHRGTRRHRQQACAGDQAHEPSLVGWFSPHLGISSAKIRM